MADAETPRANSLSELLRRGPEPPKAKSPDSSPPPAEEQAEAVPEPAATEATVIAMPPPASPAASEMKPDDAASDTAPAADAAATEPAPAEAGAAEPKPAEAEPTQAATEPTSAAPSGGAQSAAAESDEAEAAEEAEEEREAAEEAEEAGDSTLDTIVPAVPEHRPEVEPVQAGLAPIVPPPIPTDRHAPAGPAGSIAERRELLSQRLAAARAAAVRKVAEHGHAVPQEEQPAEQAEDEPMPVSEPVADAEPEMVAEPQAEVEDDVELVPATEEYVAGEEPPIEDGELEPTAYVIEAPEAVQPAIDIAHVSLRFQTRDGPVDALSDISLTIRPGEFVSLIGPSGCGKTTLLRVIADLEKPTDGMVSVNGQTPEEARRNRAYGYVFQAPALYPWRNVAKNVALPLEIMGLGVIERGSRIARNLELVNLAGFERKYPWQLSGGMQQRVSIARALAVEPDILLMDEPFGALDEIVRDHLNEQLLDLWAKTGKTVVFVTHSIPEAVFLSSRIVVMTPRPGRVCDIIESDLPLDRDLDIRESPEFLEIAHRVRQGLRAGHSYED